MNRLTIFYWMLTGLMAAFMGLGALLEVLSTPDAKALMTHLGYPLYLMPYLGVVKLLGVVAVVLPVVPARSKEWAYAGCYSTCWAYSTPLLPSATDQPDGCPLF